MVATVESTYEDERKFKSLCARSIPSELSAMAWNPTEKAR
jgi:hypothetical protein